MSATETIKGYRELSRHLRGRIEAGDYCPGTRLPTEMELSLRHSINRHTVRAAFQDLEVQGYIYRVHGKGTFVTRRKIPYAIAPDTSFTASLGKLGLEGSGNVLRAGLLAADAATARHLGLGAGTKVVTLEILRQIDRIPMCLTTSHLPAERFAGLETLAGEMRSLYGILRERYGVAGIRRAWSEIEAALPPARERELLQMPARTPLLVTRSLAADGDGRPVEYCVSRNRGDAYMLRVDFTGKGTP